MVNLLLMALVVVWSMFLAVIILDYRRYKRKQALVKRFNNLTDEQKAVFEKYMTKEILIEHGFLCR